MWRIAPVAAISVTFLLCQAAAGDMRSPRITRAEVDWEAAAISLDAVAPLHSMHASADVAAQGSTIGRLNAATADRFPGIDRSPVPVLLPFDTDAYLRDRAAGINADDPAQAYFFGFNATPFFYPGPSGYDASFRVQSVAEFAQIRFIDTAEILISGSLLTYDLDPAPSETGVPAPALEADYPGIRRILLEGQVRYAFVRFGVRYVVSTPCFDGAVARFRHMTCRDADRVIAHLIKSLRVTGGMPHALPQAAPREIERPTAVSPSFTYHGPGRLSPGTGFRGQGGQIDYTVYSAIRFPIAQAPAFANTQYFRNRTQGGTTAYPWRDNFCERRSFSVVQCPGGSGHQGQDIRAADCNPNSEGEDRCAPFQTEVVAVREGAILRAPGQEAVFLVVNTPTEHLRFRYLHMRPKLLDADGVLSGRRVEAGELIGRIGNYSQRENGTSYHLHFDVQVLTRSGWVFVNPYMTLVAAYERLIGARGEEIQEVASAALSDAAISRGPITLATIRQAILVPAEPEATPAKHDAKAAKHEAKPQRETKSQEARRPSRSRLAAANPCRAKLSRHRHWRKCEIVEAKPAKQARGARHAHTAKPAVLSRKLRRHHRA